MAIKVENKPGGVLNVRSEDKSGIVDDGSPEGLIKTKVVSGDLINIPASRVSWGSGTISRNVTNNLDGSFSSLNLIATGTIPDSAAVSFPFYGKTLGVRARRLTSFLEATAIVDGEAFPLIPSKNISSANDRESLIIVATDLPDGPHQATIILSAQSASTSLVIYGILVDKNAGYRESSRLDYLYGGQLSTTNTAIQSFLGSASETLLGIRSIRYFNTHATDPQTITLTAGTLIMYEEIIAARKTFTVDFGVNGVPFGSSPDSLVHKAGNAALVNFIIQGII